MLFEIVHHTDYRYSSVASEAYIEARLTPPMLPGQSTLTHALEFRPATAVSTYTDYYHNQVTVYSMALRHDRLSIQNRITVRTTEVPRPDDALSVSVAEARQIFSSRLTDVFDYLQPTTVVPIGGPATEWSRKIFHSDHTLGESLESLNRMVFEKFKYRSGSTTNATPLATVWKQRAGVCQDFTHIMLSVLRTAGIPARYVCGYIESDPVKPEPDASKLIGSVATHAWVEALTPGMQWIALDPTNNQWCGPRHVTMSYGRDYLEAAPVRGTFKTSGPQNMKVRVTMQRLLEKA